MRKPPRDPRLAAAVLCAALLLLAPACTPRSPGHTPSSEDLDSHETGTASWYGNEFHGRPTASGEIYDEYGMTAAHKGLPLGTVVKVTNLANGKSVDLRINDRGPFVRGRIIDVSRRAAEELGFLAEGTTEVRIDVISTR